MDDSRNAHGGRPSDQFIPPDMPGMPVRRPTSDARFLVTDAALGTKSVGALDDDDEEEYDTQLDMARIQNFGLPANGSISQQQSQQSFLQYESSGFSSYSDHDSTANRMPPTAGGGDIAHGEAVAFGMILEDSDHSSFASHELRAAVPSQPHHANHTPPRTRDYEMYRSRTPDSTSSNHNMNNNSNSINSNNNTSLDSAMRRARDSMLAFQHKDSPIVNLRPEELRVLPCPQGPEEPMIPHKTSRRCMERLRQHNRPSKPIPTLVTGMLLQKRPTRKEQMLFTVVECDDCHGELLADKSAVVVACPLCRAVTAASDGS